METRKVSLAIELRDTYCDCQIEVSYDPQSCVACRAAAALEAKDEALRETTEALEALIRGYPSGSTTERQRGVWDSDTQLRVSNARKALRAGEGS